MYARIFTKILDSSINMQSVPPSVRWLWMTMLLLADEARTGVVDMPAERLAARAGLTLDQTLEGLAVLSAPDRDSYSKDEEGRRIVPLDDDSGRRWLLVNWEKYKKVANQEQEREMNRMRVKLHREEKKRKDGSNGSVMKCNASEASDSQRQQQRQLQNPFAPLSQRELPDEVENLFNDTWSLYPRKRGKAAAEKSYRKQILTRADLHAIESAVRNFVEEIRILGTDEQHIPYGSTWFAGQWRDFVDGTWTPPMPPAPRGNGKPRSDLPEGWARVGEAWDPRLDDF